MLSISIFELIPDSTFTLYDKFGLIWTIIIGSSMFILGKTIVTKLNNKITLLSNNNLYRVGVLSMIALLVHNFPEGIATFMASYNDLSSGINLGIAIMLHNIPEGISIAVPIYYASNKKSRGLIMSLISGLAEPLGAILAYILLKDYISDCLISIVLMIVSGIMVTLAINEMLPEVNKYNYKNVSITAMIIGLILVLTTTFIF